jgi:glyoxylase-like metal-dependent hydrolase (beta-lactamase superfamily II)
MMNREKMGQNHAPALQIEGRAGGPVMTMTYRLNDRAGGAWALVDPTFGVLETCRDWLEGGPPPQAILITHAHFDHIGGLPDLVRRYPGVEVWSHADGEALLGDAKLNGAARFGLPCEPCRATRHWREGDTLELGEARLRVIEAPGHCPGSVVLVGGGALIAGDVLFKGAVGRWDLPGANYATLARTIREKIMRLPDETVVYPGHGPATTIGEERRENEIVRQMLAGRDF